MKRIKPHILIFKEKERPPYEWYVEYHGKVIKRGMGDLKTIQSLVDKYKLKPDIIDPHFAVFWNDDETYSMSVKRMGRRYSPRLDPEDVELFIKVFGEPEWN